MKYLPAISLTIMLCLPLWVTAQQTAKIISFEDLEERINTSEKPLTVVNFWATWCAPCIKELPYIEEAYQQNKSRMDLVLVNLDFADDIDKVNSFIARKSLTGEVLLLDNLDYNSWIDRIDPSWSGAIPATLFINQQKDIRKFIEGEITAPELAHHLDEMIN